MSSANPFARAARAAVADVLRSRDVRSDGDRAQDRVLRIVLRAQSLDEVRDMPRAVAAADLAAGAHASVPAAAGGPSMLRIGIDGAERFGYPQVRAFALTLVTAAAAAGDARLTVQLPGIDLGLDPLDCLEHFIVGLAAAVADADDTLPLHTVCITEPSSTLRSQYREQLARLLADIPAGWRAEPGSVDQWPLRCVRQAEGAGTDRRLEARLTHQELFTAFVAMPFRKDMLDTFEFGIRQPSREVGFRAERLDQETYTGGVLEMIRQRIGAAHVVIADLTHTNPNVFLEIGYAWAKQRPTILLAHRPPALEGQPVQTPQLPFDVSGQKVLIYETLGELGPMLQKELSALRQTFLRPAGLP